MQGVDYRISALLRRALVLWMKCGWLLTGVIGSVDETGLCSDVHGEVLDHPMVLHKVCTAGGVIGVTQAAKVFWCAECISRCRHVAGFGKRQRLER